MIETFHYPQGASARAPEGDAFHEYHDFVEMAMKEGVSIAGAREKPRPKVPPALDSRLLEHAGRVAWRNSTRCIGRLFWRSLVVRDLRHVDDADDVVEACLEHLRMATNGGRIKPVLSVFAPANESGQSIRILNHQLIRYAGYEIGGGKILGDPQNAAFTRFAMECGWKPPADPGPFDLLPLVIRMPGESVRWYEIPPGEVLEVSIRHPRFPWFAHLGLKWHAVPVISDMCFAAAGARYPCAPFSGWYMATEIAARNLSDTNRYDMLPTIAEKMGLKTSLREPLWKDRALIELNEAVIHSFEADGVMMIDHHNASQQFMQFMKREGQCGRVVKGDWSWLVPPVSGSTSPVFHTSLDPRSELPNFFYQDSDLHA
jgi:nitric-oxide synthase, bacterial